MPPGQVLIRRQLKRRAFLAFFQKLRKSMCSIVFRQRPVFHCRSRGFGVMLS